MWISKSAIKDLEDILEKISQSDRLDDFYFDEIEKEFKSKKVSNRLKKVFKKIDELQTSKENVKLGQESIVELNKKVLEYETLIERMKFSISHICKHIGATKGVIYFLEDKKELKLYASYAFLKRDSSKTSYKIGEGIVGQVALEKESILLRNLQEDFDKTDDHKITTGSTVSNALQTYTTPLVYQDELLGVVEVATTKSLSDDELDFLNKSTEALSAIVSIARRYEITKQQAAELEVQARELEQQTSEIEKQNQELETQTREIEESKKELEQQNVELLASQEEVKRKIKELEDSNRYKTDFLSNMSHELRTPLNSINILSSVLAKNREKNLSADQIKQLRTIHQAGSDLLTLINDLLDLSKIDAQMMTLSLSNIDVKELLRDIFNIFEPLAEQNRIKLLLDIDENIDPILFSDAEKIKQILRNFISNALKFTEKDRSVTIGVRKTDNKKLPIEIYAKDEGIGIPKEKIDEIFEAFRQVDISTSRKYGGTGLGLAITKKLANLLGGEVKVSSKVGQGSTFSIVLPLKIDTSKIDKKLIDIVEDDNQNSLDSDQEFGLQPNILDTKIETTTPKKIEPQNTQNQDGDAILIIEDDETFANVLRDEVERLGYRSLYAHNGLDGIKLASSQQPLGIILDINLPLMDGWDVVKELKKDLKTRHIPIKVISADDSHKSIKSLVLLILSKNRSQQISLTT